MPKRKKKPQKLGEFIELDDRLQDLVDLNLPLVAGRHQLDLNGIPLKLRNKVNRRGDLAQTIDGTLKRCDSQCRQLWPFLAQRGAWDSMLILLCPVPEDETSNCPAMDALELCNFVRHKMNPDGMALRAGNSEDSEPPLDVFGAPMTCVGGWKAGKTMDVFGAAISSIHRCHNHTGKCFPSCQACQANEETLKNGCQRHKDTWGSLKFRKGNPIKFPDFPTNKQTSEDPKCLAKVSTQVDPGDIRAIRKAMLGGMPTLAGLKFYTMALICIKLFLRADEVIKLGVADCPPLLFYRVNGAMKAIGMSITGKTDEGVLRWCLLFMDSAFPDICPLTHLLVYLHYSGITGGYLFPPDADPHDEDIRGVCTTHESHRTMLTTLKKLAKAGVFDYNVNNKKSSDFRATIHIFRKGAYYFRIIAEPTDDIDWCSLRYDARHEREGDMFIYVRDAATLRQTIDFVKSPEMRASDNGRVRFQTRCAAEKYFRKTSDATGLTLPELAKQYVYSLGVGPNPSLREAIEEAVKPRDLSFEEKQQRFVNTLSREQLLHCQLVMDELTRRQNALIQQQNEAAAKSQQAVQVQVAAPKRKKKQQSTANNSPQDDLLFQDDSDVVGRDKVKNLPGIKNKIEAFQQMEQRMPPKDSQLTGPAKKWAIQSLRPALLCLRCHYNGDIEAHETAWNNSPVSWKMKHPCDGGKKVNKDCVALVNNSS